MERWSIDFKGPLRSSSQNTYMLTIVDEYSRFPFAFSCPNTTSAIVMKCLDKMFVLCGTPSYIQSDCGSSFLRTQNLSDNQWEIVLLNVLHSIRSFLSTATNTTHHERFFGFQHRSPCGSSLPTWLSTPDNVMLRRFVHNSKNDPLVDKVELTSVNPAYANIQYPDGRVYCISKRLISVPISRIQPTITIKCEHP